MTINERFKKILDTLNISVEDCAKRFGKTEGYIRKLSRSGESFGIEPIMMILNSIDGVDANWLLKEEGEMMKNNYTNNVNVADNASVRNVIGNINGHSINNVDAPKAESVKIIKPDGTVETYTSNHSLQELLDLKEQLRATMVELESKKREISSLEKIIEAKDETISILKNEHNKK